MGPDERLASAFAETHPVDAARVLERVDPRDAAAVLTALPPRVAGEVLRLLGPAAIAGCTAELTDHVLTGIAAELPIDAAVTTLRSVPRERQEAVFAGLPDALGGALRRLLSYAPDTAGALADPRVLALPDDITVGEAQKQVRASDRRLAYYLYVVARDQRLVGVLDVTTLMAARPKETLLNLMHRDPVRLEAHVSLATVAVHPAWRDFDVLPVVGTNDTLLGVIRHKVVRQTEASRQRARSDSMVATVVGLSELYWAGLSGMLTSLSARPAPQDQREETRDAT